MLRFRRYRNSQIFHDGVAMHYVWKRKQIFRPVFHIYVNCMKSSIFSVFWIDFTEVLAYNILEYGKEVKGYVEHRAGRA